MSYQQEVKPSAVLRYWPLIVGTIAIIMSYAALQSAQANADQRIDKVELKQVSIDTSTTEMKVQLSAIQSDLQWIKTALANKAKQP